MRRLTMRRLLGVAMVTLGSSGGCTDVGGPGSSGELGYGTFRWECAGAGDVACVDGRIQGFPTTVALGAEIEMSFGLRSSVPVRTGWLELAGSSRARELSRSSAPGYDYVPNCDIDYELDCDQAGSSSARYQAEESGLVSIMGLAEDGTVGDFVTLSIAPVTSLAVVRSCSGSGSASCGSDEHDGDVVTHGDVGETIQLRVEPYAAGELLMGHLDYSWVSLDPSVAGFTSTEGHVATLELRQSGTAYVQVAGGGGEDTVAVEVLLSDDGPQRRPPEGGGETEGGTADGGTDTDAATGSGSDSGSGSGTDTSTGTGTGTGSTGGMQ